LSRTAWNAAAQLDVSISLSSDLVTPEQEALDFAPYFALNDRASDFAKASSFANATEDRTPDKSQGKQDRFCGCFLNFVLWLFELVRSP